MSAHESRLIQRIRVAATKAGARLFRNNVGRIRVPESDRYVQYGLSPGSGDLIGWVPVRIEQHHVGQTVAVFASIEVKTATQKAESAQIAWRDAVRGNGGIAAVVYNEPAALDALKQFGIDWTVK